MWGGIAGVLPDLNSLISKYHSGVMETPNIDQIFLRDSIWPLICNNSLIHDRYFESYNSKRWPEADPEGDLHVGQNIMLFEKRHKLQEFHIGLLNCNQ